MQVKCLTHRASWYTVNSPPPAPKGPFSLSKNLRWATRMLGSQKTQSSRCCPCPAPVTKVPPGATCHLPTYGFLTQQHLCLSAADFLRLQGCAQLSVGQARGAGVSGQAIGGYCSSPVASSRGQSEVRGACIHNLEGAPRNKGPVARAGNWLMAHPGWAFLPPLS